jgi:hypothetical protein
LVVCSDLASKQNLAIGNVKAIIIFSSSVHIDFYPHSSCSYNGYSVAERDTWTSPVTAPAPAGTSENEVTTMKTRTLVLVLGDQLAPLSPAFEGFDAAQDLVWMAELPEESEHPKSNKARTLLFLSAMRHFAKGLARALRLAGNACATTYGSKNCTFFRLLSHLILASRLPMSRSLSALLIAKLKKCSYFYVLLLVISWTPATLTSNRAFYSALRPRPVNRSVAKRRYKFS